MTSVTIDRSSLSKAALVISEDTSATYVIAQGGLGRPSVNARTTTVTAPWIHGSVVTSVTRDDASLPLTVIIQAADAASLKAATDDLDEALWQFSYPVTVAEGSNTVTRSASPASYGLTDTVTPSNVAEHFEVWAITIPVYPVSA